MKIRYPGVSSIVAAAVSLVLAACAVLALVYEWFMGAPLFGVLSVVFAVESAIYAKDHRRHVTFMKEIEELERKRGPRV